MDIYALKNEISKQDLKKEFLNHKRFEEIWEEYQKQEKMQLKKLSTGEAMDYIKSHLNFFERKEEVIYRNEEIKIGDICYIDYGINYKQECGYFHMGLIIDIKQYEYLILPMTSNVKAFEKAVFWKKSNLLPLPHVDHIEKNTTIFLNDARFINSARIIMKVSNIEKNSAEFKHIKTVFYNYLISRDN